MNKNGTFYVLGLIVGLALLIIEQLPSRIAKLIVCDVGQGDAILIIKGSTQVLVDGGPSGEKVLNCLNEFIPFWDRNIELIVLTNTDYDHINGLSSVIERYSLTAFVTGDGVHESEALERFVGELQATGVSSKMVEMGDRILVGTRDRLEFKVLWPSEVDRSYLAVFSAQNDDSTIKQILGASAKQQNYNERSVVLLLREENYKVLLTGDSGFQAEKGMEEANMLENVDLLKVGHHGSKYSSNEEFLASIDAEIAVISVGARNRYGHPTNETLTRLKKMGSEIYRTDEEGTIVLELHN